MAAVKVSNADLSNAFGGASANSNSIALLAPPLADPDPETLRQKSNESLVVRRRKERGGPDYSDGT